MAASSKPTAVHFAFAFSVMTTLILALVCYLTAKENQTLRTAAETARAAAATAEANDRRSFDEIQLLKNALGYPDYEQVGTEADNTPNSVLGALRSDLAKYGPDLAQPGATPPTVAGVLQSYHAALNAAQEDVRQRQQELASLQAQLAQEMAAHTKRIDEIKASQTDSETRRQQLIASNAEILSQKDQEIGKWRDEYRREQREKEALRDELEALRRNKNAEIQDLENVVAYLRQRLNELEDLSFDKADGEIVRVDNTTRAVWINLGSDDGIKPQVSFAVYTKSHSGFGRGNADIKAKIEVTKIRGPHLSEARILKDDIGRPIQAGDPIYSPVWSRGMQEQFSFVGIVDMDGDGKSDRELLHNVLENAGARVELEIDDDGNRIPEDGNLTVNSKFLVIGRIEDPSEYPGTDTKKQEAIRKVLDEYTALTKEALRKGIKTVSFNDFLNYMGYSQQHRLYNAGEDQPFNLKYGSRSAATGEELGNSRRSSGQTSSRFKPVDKTQLNQ